MLGLIVLEKSAELERDGGTYNSQLCCCEDARPEHCRGQCAIEACSE